MFAQPAEHPKNELLSLEVKTASTSRVPLLVFISQPAITEAFGVIGRKRWRKGAHVLSIAHSWLLQPT
jgi:hypothetical protein